MATTRVAKTLSIYRQEAKDGIIWDRAPGEEASQTFTAGAPLVRDGTSKELEIWPGTTDAGKPVGIAVAAASGTAGTKVGYYEANDYNLFEGTLINATTAYVLLGTEVGTTYSLIASGNDWLIDIADTTTDLVEVVGLISDVGDTNPRVIFRFVTGVQGNVQAAQ
jgi:hypothetical protein